MGQRLQSSDPFFDGMTTKETIAHITRIASEGGLSGIEDFFAKCTELGTEIRKRRGALAIELANDLERASRRLDNELAKAPPSQREQAYRAIAAAFLYANLKRELDRGADPDGESISMDRYFDVARRFRKHEDRARELGMTARGLTKWEKRNLAGDAEL